MHCGWIVGVMQHGGANVGDEVLFDRELVELTDEGEGLIFGEAGDELGEWLGGDADGLHFVAGGLKLRLGFAQNDERVGNLLLPGVSVEADEAGDGADFWIRWRRGSGGGL